jgi:hypothetical protein
MAALYTEAGFRVRAVYSWLSLMHEVRSIGAPLLVLAALVVLGAASLERADRSCLHNSPPILAAQEHPDRWTSKAGYLPSMGAASFLTPLCILGFGFAFRAVAGKFLSLPQGEYWCSPECREKTNGYLARQFAWMACGMMGLLFTLNCLIVEANREVLPRLSNAVWVLLVVCLASVAVWIGVLIRHFSKWPADG